MANIKIIDDDVELAEDMATILRGEGHEVTMRDAVDGAAEALKADKPDLLILDVMFPENPSAGFDLARELRQTPGLEALPIIMLTGVNQQFPMDFSADDISEDWLPVQDFLEKPVLPSVITAKVSELLGKQGEGEQPAP